MKRQAAADHYAIALKLESDAPRALAGLAWLRATAPEAAVRNPDEAVRLAERTAELTSRRDAGGFQSLWVDIRERLKLYEHGRPFVDK